jgi:hypothetical protein
MDRNQKDFRRRTIDYGVAKRIQCDCRTCLDIGALLQSDGPDTIPSRPLVANMKVVSRFADEVDQSTGCFFQCTTLHDIPVFSEERAYIVRARGKGSLKFCMLVRLDARIPFRDFLERSLLGSKKVKSSSIDFNSRCYETHEVNMTLVDSNGMKPLRSLEDNRFGFILNHLACSKHGCGCSISDDCKATRSVSIAVALDVSGTKGVIRHELVDHESQLSR